MGFVTVIDTSLYFSPYAPVGSPPQTNTTTKTMLTNIVSGDFYILPATNCGVQILSNVLTTAVGVTNIIDRDQRADRMREAARYLLSRTYVNWFTNHSLAYFPVLCVTNEPGLRRGVEKLTFVKTAYDSLLGQFYTPQTNYFTMTTVTNSTNWVQTYQRVVTAPDFLFSAADLAPGPASRPVHWSDVARNVNFNSNNVLPGLAGPGTIDPPTTITFNKAGPIFYQHQLNKRCLLSGSGKLVPLQMLCGARSMTAPMPRWCIPTAPASPPSRARCSCRSPAPPCRRARSAWRTPLN